MAEDSSAKGALIKKLRQDMEKEIQKNRDDIAQNRQEIAIIQTRMGHK